MRARPLRRGVLQLLLVAAAAAAAAAAAPSVQTLDSWTLVSPTATSRVYGEAGGAAASDPRRAAPSGAGVHAARVPCTVLACLVEAGVYPEPTEGTNLQGVPAAQFNASWWYRASFATPGAAAGGAPALLSLLGVNYRANVWLNGRLVANSTAVVGAFRRFDLAVALARGEGAPNAVAVEVFRPHDEVFPPDNNSTDLSLTFIDWAPHPPDGSMGLFGAVTLTSVPAGVPLLLAPSAEVAAPPAGAPPTPAGAALAAAPLNVTVSVRVLNLGGAPLRGVELEASLDGRALPAVARVPLVPAAGGGVPGEASAVFPAAAVAGARLWWPWQMTAGGGGGGNATLVPLEVRAPSAPGGAASASVGLRWVRSELAARSGGHRLFSVNGHAVLVRGGGWAPDLLLRDGRGPAPPSALHLALARDLGLNTVRLEGRAPPGAFFAECDRLGLLVLAGWSCCDAWQHWDAWGAEQHAVAAASMRDQARRLRSHPSLLAWLVGSDQQPPAAVERSFRAELAAARWPAAVLNSAQALDSPVSGPSGVKMSGPYAWEPPSYWLAPPALARLGGAAGFLTEGSPGAAPLELPSWRRALGGRASPWPPGPEWRYHCANPAGLFHDLRFFTPALDARMGAASSARQYLASAQAAAFESHRAMFEAYSRNKYRNATGVVQWMLNNPWPSHVWHLFDYYLAGGGSYHGARAAMRPLQAMHSPDDGSVWVINSLYAPVAAGAYLARATLLALDGRAAWRAEAPLPALPADASLPVPGLALPARLPEALGETYLLRLEIVPQAAGAPAPERASNDYWLSRAPDTLDWEASNFYRTPLVSHANLTALARLGCANVTAAAAAAAAAAARPEAAAGGMTVRVANAAGGAVAFMVRVAATCDGVEVLPALWTDNYLVLLPGESRRLGVRWPRGDPPCAAPVLEVTTHNDAFCR